VLIALASRIAGLLYLFLSALPSIACPVLDISLPKPAVVLQAPSREAAPESTRRLRKIIVRGLRI